MKFNEKYVSADATGGGDGSAEHPWTLAEAVANATVGERVHVKAGVYETPAGGTD